MKCTQATSKEVRRESLIKRSTLTSVVLEVFTAITLEITQKVKLWLLGHQFLSTSMNQLEQPMKFLKQNVSTVINEVSMRGKGTSNLIILI